MFTDYIYNYLDNALDVGITEKEFWEMTLAEFDRVMLSKKRVKEAQDKEKAIFDYILADLLAHSLARLKGAKNMPSIEKVYPTLFNQNIESKKDEISAIRFKLFADKYNKQFKGG